MKKTINIILIFALLSAMALPTAGCKKTQTEPKTVNVTFVAEGNAKTTISPRGVVEFIPGDQIHVFDANYGYLGYLDYQHAGSAKGGPATFYGALKQWNDNTTLRFIYMGNHTPTFGKTTKVNFLDQSYEGEQSPERDLENIAENFLVSNYEEQNVPADKLEYTGHLTSVMSILALNTSAFDDGTNVKIIENGGASLYNRITINDKGVVKTDNTASLSEQIVTGPGQALRYVAVLPYTYNLAILHKLYLTSNAKEGNFDLTAPIMVNTLITDYKNTVIPATPVTSNDYVDMAVASDHVFTVNSSGKQVKFAKGNLVYDKGRFKMHKTPFVVYEYNTNSSSPSLLSTFDHFAWATSCWDNGNQTFMPHNYGHDLEGTTWGPINNNTYYDMIGDYAKADWGVYQFGMNAGGSWRTLTEDEMDYILKKRGGNMFLSARITIDKVKYQGLIILPDNFNATLTGNYSYNSTTTIYNVTNDEWSTMETAGAVFLQRAGMCILNRNTNTYQDQTAPNPNDANAGAGVDGFYWLNKYKPANNVTYAYYLRLDKWNGNCYTSTLPKGWMFSVRLVSDVN